MGTGSLGPYNLTEVNSNGYLGTNEIFPHKFRGSIAYFSFYNVEFEESMYQSNLLFFVFVLLVYI